MASAGSSSPFQEHVDDTTPVQRKVMHDYIVPIRTAMGRIMRGPGDPRKRSTIWRSAGGSDQPNVRHYSRNMPSAAAAISRAVNPTMAVVRRGAG